MNTIEQHTEIFFKDPSIVETFYNKIEKGKTCGGKIIEHQNKFLVVFPDEREEDVIRKHTYLFIKKSKHMEKIDLNGIWKTDSNNTFKFKGNEFEYSTGGKAYNGTFETSEDEIKNERTIKFPDHIKDINIWIKQDDENITLVENSGKKIELKKISN